jgi:hypothetical protein
VEATKRKKERKKERKKSSRVGPKQSQPTNHETYTNSLSPPPKKKKKKKKKAIQIFFCSLINPLSSPAPLYLTHKKALKLPCFLITSLPILLQKSLSNSRHQKNKRQHQSIIEHQHPTGISFFLHPELSLSLSHTL